MKKILAFMAAALTVIAVSACGDKQDPDDNNPDDKENNGGQNNNGGDDKAPTLVLTAANVDVSGIDKDCLVIVDQSAKTIKITLDYSDKNNAKGLTVSFLNIPEGITAEYQKTFNYSDGATQTVAFKYNEKTIDEFVISVSLGAPDPKFASLTVNGIDALSGEVHMASAAALSHLPVEFEVEPEETVVSVNGEAIESGAELDFSDKMNGVTFTLTCGEATNSLKVIVITSGLRKATRVWGHYANPQTVDDDWFQTKANDLDNLEKHWLRTCAMDGQYVYLAQHQGAATPTYVLSLEDGSIVGRMSVEGISGGTHQTSCVRTIPDGDGGYKILQCNLAIGGTLKVYKWDSKDSAPETALSYENVDGLRLGDKMGVWGTWKDGTISFLATAGNPRKIYLFKVTNGTIDATPTVADLGDMGNGSYGQAYWYSDTEILASVAGTKPMTYTWNGSAFTLGYSDEDSLVFGSTDQGFNFFTFNDKKYMAFMHLESGLKDGSLRILDVTGETLADAMKAADANHVFRYGIGDPNECPINGNPVANSLADCTVREIGGEVYVCGVVADGGVSLFKLEK